ncbi:nucleoside-diphosphate sugar epimerase/dehydratase [Denitrificimonas sp. JX-1]|uniref:Nucleoside-diphosphate sugar epimerase/dehydratase n=1 Tax=Denitrificimonas halotolerans TaxID=3098930 RepID=A0ABU5GR17_9GAMM|nr:nucleoside-diphosphate sugar epimerase/dehydratase [Denitrificimonas sp. JX-1]MDY7219426.1 nucleoside-diphosphate sugar epimerase/dehydratase [Denitrificimonas sp. JX-1]
MRKWLISWEHKYKRLAEMSTDTVLVVLALALAWVVQLGVSGAYQGIREQGWLLLVAPLISLPIFNYAGMYRYVMRHSGLDALITIARATTLSALVLGGLMYWRLDDSTTLALALLLNYWWISLVLLGGLRLLLRHYFIGGSFSLASLLNKDNRRARVAIYGAGSAGQQLLTSLRLGNAMRPVAFIDDDPSLEKRVIAGLKVYQPRDIQQLLRESQASQVLLALPSVSRSRRREILDFLEPYPVFVLSIPGMAELAGGKVTVQDLHEVDIIDLLGRDAVVPDSALFKRCIAGKVVMVTGAGGSIGSELCRQIIRSGVKTLLLFEHSEYNAYQISTELAQTIKEQGLDVNLVSVLGSVRKYKPLLEVMKTWQVQTLYHAAAYKHVPIVENNIAGGVFNNVFGTLNAAQAAMVAQVENFVLVSTDKAVRPTNVMGATKRLAEMLLQALSAESQPRLLRKGERQKVHNRTRFTMVRFGNVLGSSGSVIPLFREQIARGGPVTVTDPEITRYFMTIPEAAQLVIQAGSMGQGGDVFVLDMGEPVRIVELAEKMIHLSGLTVRSADNPHGDISIEFTGLRPGEKLYEELLIGDNVTATEHPMIMRANEAFIPWPEYCQLLQRLRKAAMEDDCTEVREILCQYVDGYVAQGAIVDLIYTKRCENRDLAQKI